MKRLSNAAPRAFTLVELLVVIAIIGALVALLVPALQMVRASAANAACVNNLRQIGLALNQFHEINGSFPSAEFRPPPDYFQAGWMFAILPYIEQKAVYDQVDQESATAVIPTYVCAADPRANAGQDTLAQSVFWPSWGVINWG